VKWAVLAASCKLQQNANEGCNRCASLAAAAAIMAGRRRYCG